MKGHELSAMLDADDRHWWYVGRRRVLRAVLDSLPLMRPSATLDAGCGSGRTLDDLARYGPVAGVDASSTAVERARGRGHADVHVAPVEELPFQDARFDLITCLDVIEHTPDDRRTLRELLRVARPGAHLVVTVPAYPALWSSHDERNLHHRRYRRAGLQAAAVAAGWTVVWDTYFNSLLLPPAAAVRLAERVHRRAPKGSDLDLTPPRLDAVLKRVLEAEAAVLARGRRLPAGLSLLAVLRKDRINGGRRVDASRPGVAETA